MAATSHAVALSLAASIFSAIGSYERHSGLSTNHSVGASVSTHETPDPVPGISRRWPDRSTSRSSADPMLIPSSDAVTFALQLACTSLASMVTTERLSSSGAARCAVGTQSCARSEGAVTLGHFRWLTFTTAPLSRSSMGSAGSACGSSRLAIFSSGL